MVKNYIQLGEENKEKDMLEEKASSGETGVDITCKLLFLK